MPSLWLNNPQFVRKWNFTFYSFYLDTFLQSPTLMYITCMCVCWCLQRVHIHSWTLRLGELKLILLCCSLCIRLMLSIYQGVGLVVVDTGHTDISTSTMFLRAYKFLYIQYTKWTQMGFDGNNWLTDFLLCAHTLLYLYRFRTCMYVCWFNVISLFTHKLLRIKFGFRDFPRHLYRRRKKQLRRIGQHELRKVNVSRTCLPKFSTQFSCVLN